MRKLLITCALVALAVPVAATAAKRAPNDGTLQVRNANAEMIKVVARGGLIGRCGQCVLTITDPVLGDGSGPIVFGFDSEVDLTGPRTRWVNRSPREDMRFRIIGGRYTAVIRGTDINLSVVGTGAVWMKGAPGFDGEYAFDGSDFASLPDILTRFELGSSKNANNG